MATLRFVVEQCSEHTGVDRIVWLADVLVYVCLGEQGQGVARPNVIVTRHATSDE